MKRSTLVATVAVDLAKRQVNADRLPTAIEEWLSENAWAGDAFDRGRWDWRRFVLDVSKVFDSHAGEM